MYVHNVKLSYYSLRPKRLFWNETCAKVEGGDFEEGEAKLKEQPHYFLANLRPEPKSFASFVKRYGLPYRDSTPQDVRQKRKLIDVRSVYFVYWDHLKAMQQLLQQAWRGEADAIQQIENTPKAGPSPLTGPIQVEPRVRATGIELWAIDLWNFIRINFLCDYHAGKARVCGNPNCETKFFLAGDRRKSFCSRECAVLTAVRRYRDRQKKGLRLLRDAEKRKLHNVGALGKGGRK